MRLFIISLLLIFIGLISYQNVRFYMDWREVRLEYESLQGKLEALREENKSMEDNLNYFQNSENLEKEVRAQLNYKKPGEKVIIVIPKQNN